MKFLLRVLFIMLVFLVLLGLAGIVLPDKVSYQNSIFIQSSKEIPIELVSRIDKWPNWFELFFCDSTLDFDVPEEKYGIGSTITYKSINPNLESGQIELTDILPGIAVEASININEFSNYILNFNAADSADGCIITASYKNDNLGFVEKYIQFFYKAENEAILNNSLEKLKTYSEKIKYSRTGLAYKTNMPVKKAILLADSCSKSALDSKINELNRTLTWYFRYKEIKKPEDYFLIYHQWKDTSKLIFSVGFEVDNFVKTYGKYKYIEFDSTAQAAAIDYFGLPEKNDKAYLSLETYIEKERLNTSGKIWVQNIFNQENETDTCKWLIKLYSPIE